MRRALAVFVAIILVFTPITVQAASTRSISIQPNISYSGNKATCSASIIANSPSDYLEATIKLWRGNLCIETWEETGPGYIFFSETAPVIQGKTHTLTVDLFVNGVSQGRVAVSK